jgi:hypothetical protein
LPGKFGRQSASVQSVWPLPGHQASELRRRPPRSTLQVREDLRNELRRLGPYPRSLPKQQTRRREGATCRAKVKSTPAGGGQNEIRNLFGMR